MSFRNLFLVDAGNPAFNQPVPLRLVPAITNWSVVDLLRLLGIGIEESDRAIFILSPEVYDGKKISKNTHPSYYAELLRLNPEISIHSLPSNHFVWSDDLISAVSNFIDLTIGRKAARDSGIRTVWNPDTSTIQQDIETCPDFEMLLPKGILNTSRTQQMYAGWCAQRQNIIDTITPEFQLKNGKPNEFKIAAKIAETAHKDIGHIRKMIRKHCLK